MELEESIVAIIGARAKAITAKLELLEHIAAARPSDVPAMLIEVRSDAARIGEDVRCLQRIHDMEMRFYREDAA